MGVTDSSFDTHFRILRHNYLHVLNEELHKNWMEVSKNFLGVCMIEQVQRMMEFHMKMMAMVVCMIVKVS